MAEPIATDFSLDDLMADGPEGETLRRAVAEGVALGAVDPMLAIQVAGICCQRANPAMAVSFVGVALRVPLPPEDGWTAAIRRVVDAAVLGAPGGDTAILPELGRALDGAHEVTYMPAMDATLKVFAARPEKGAAIAARSWEEPGARGSEAFLAICMAAHLFANDIAAAGRIGTMLAARPRLRERTLGALSKLALAQGNYAWAEELSRRAIAQEGEKLFALMNLAVALFCQGRLDEGRQAMARSAELLKSSAVVDERRAEIADWARQFDEALAKRTVDGGEMGRIGSSIYYTHPEQVRPFYDAHREECTAKNTYRTVSGYTNTVMFGEVETLLAARPEIRKVINYGTLCGVREDELAARHPEVTWAGYDIADLATEWNRAAYVRDNLIFESDFEKLLADLAGLPGETLMVHCRTADIMLPEALRRLYLACRAGGVGHIMTSEYFCRRISNLNYPDFANEPVDAVHWDGILMVHNYAKVLPETGYRVTGTAYRPVPILISANGEGYSNDQLIELVWAEADGS